MPHRERQPLGISAEDAYKPPVSEGSTRDPEEIDAFRKRPHRANAATMAAGLATTALTLALVILVQAASGEDIFSYVVAWMPGGAVLIGLCAASGYLFGALRWHARPSRVLTIGMIALTAMLQIALYFVRYELAESGHGHRVADAVGFFDYLNYELSHQVYTHGTSHFMKPVELGVWGYALAFLQFLGLILAAAVIFIALRSRAYCDTCTRYARPLHFRHFDLDLTAGSSLESRLRKLTPLSPAYWAALEADDGMNSTKGVNIETYQCPVCRRMAASETPTTRLGGKSGRSWRQQRVFWVEAPASTDRHREVGSQVFP